MLPAPARIAAPPRPKSRGSWNPAVPPPPVAGAAAGIGLADLLRVDGGDAEGLGVVLGVVALVVRLGEAVGVADGVPAGENGVVSVAVGEGVAEGEDGVQAETDAEASMTSMPLPIAVNLALSVSLAMVARSFMEPPHASARWHTRFPVPASETVRGRGIA
jgi:hypothetical protein